MSAVPVGRLGDSPPQARVWAYLMLTKPDVTFLVVLTTLAGFHLGSPGPLDFVLLVRTLFGTTLIAAGTSALNHYLERGSDAKMRRTVNRPLPRGKLRPAEALFFGVGLVLAGTACLVLRVNLLSGALGVAACASYLAAYTPLKTRTTFATFVGAFPGAVPPLIGWAAASGSLTLQAGILYAILFLWQFPHFLSIAWIYREDYARAGILMLPVVDRSGTATFRQILGYSVALVPASLLPSVVGMAGKFYLVGALLLGLALVQLGVWASQSKTNVRAKCLLQASVVYIPLLFGLMMLDKITG